MASGPTTSSQPAAPATIEAAELLADLRRRRAGMVELLERLVRAESPSGEREAQRAPFSILAAELEAAGLEVEALPGREVGEHLIARPPGLPDDAPYQLLLGHMDTVWPLRTLERMPVRIEDGRLHGPGAYDMKGGLVQMVHALQALAARGARPDHAPLVMINSDEELGSPESSEHVHRLAAGASRAFVVEPSLGPRGLLKTARKGVGRFRVSVGGRASHAGLEPEAGASAILEATHQIQRIFDLNDPERGVTVNVGTIDGGLGPNVVAPEVSALVDVRAACEEDAERVEEALRGLEPVAEGASISVQGHFARPPLERTPRNRALWETARAVAAELGIEIGEALAGGASDGNLASIHTATLDGLGAIGDGAHAPHEHVVIERMAERAALLAMLLLTPVSEVGQVAGTVSGRHDLESAR